MVAVMAAHHNPKSFARHRLWMDRAIKSKKSRKLIQVKYLNMPTVCRGGTRPDVRLGESSGYSQGSTRTLPRRSPPESRPRHRAWVFNRAKSSSSPAAFPLGPVTTSDPAFQWPEQAGQSNVPPPLPQAVASPDRLPIPAVSGIMPSTCMSPHLRRVELGLVQSRRREGGVVLRVLRSGYLGEERGIDGLRTAATSHK